MRHPIIDTLTILIHNRANLVQPNNTQLHYIWLAFHTASPENFGLHFTDTPGCSRNEYSPFVLQSSVLICSEWCSHQAGHLAQQLYTCIASCRTPTTDYHPSCFTINEEANTLKGNDYYTYHFYVQHFSLPTQCVCFV
jgi:hypothetical protein